MSSGGVKQTLLSQPLLRGVWAAWRRRALHRAYGARRQRYAAMAEQCGLVYREETAIAAIRERLAKRGCVSRERRSGEIHTFAFIPRIGWHGVLYNDLARLGPVTEFDYVGLGYHPQEFLRRDRRAAVRRREMNERALAALRLAHSQQVVDWVVVYASGLEVRSELIRSIVRELNLPVVTMCLDDKQSWEGPPFDGQRLGQIDIAPTFDICWTSATVACEWYLCEGALPLYMPEGFDAVTCAPRPVDRDIAVSFVGAAYGFRSSLIADLRRQRIPVQAFGPGWGTGWVDPAEIANRSRINLGLGGIGYSETLTNVKTRDFEIPGTGGGMYLTSFNPDLARHFVVGQEIACYRNREEMVELIRYYLARPEEASAMATRARARCVAEHRWLHRFQKICRILGILPEMEDAGE